MHNARSLLVETGVLPARVEYLDRLTPWLEQTLAAVPAGPARYVRQFANWWLLRRARNRSRVRPYTPAAADGIRLRVSTAIAFLTWLKNQYVEFPQVAQPHIDRWLADGPGHRRTLRPFIQWARQRHLVAEVDVPPAVVAAPAHLQDDHEQWRQLRHCLHEESMPLHLRAAGGLILLFGLSVTRIASLTLGQIEHHHSKTHLVLARHHLLVPPILGRLLLQQRDHAAGRWAIGATAGAGRPLIPGLHGRPANPNALQNTLKRHGIRPRTGRNTALAALAGDLPRSSSPTSSGSESPLPPAGPVTLAVTGHPSWQNTEPTATVSEQTQSRDCELEPPCPSTQPSDAPSLVPSSDVAVIPALWQDQ